VTLFSLSEEEIIEEETYSVANLYPNIVYDDINLEIENENATSAKLTIVNSNGQIVHEMEENLDFGKNIFTYNETNNLDSGMYFLTIQMGAHTEVKKFSKITE